MQDKSHKKRNVTFQGNPLTLVGNSVNVGDKAPNFSLTTNELKSLSLSDFKDKILVLSVVPSIDTSVCDIQGRRFNEEAKKLKADVAVVLVSLDTPFAQARWKKEAKCSNIEALSDYKDRDFALAYGVLIDELKLLSRSVFIIGKDQTIKYAEYVDEITHEPKYDQALEVLKKL
jgi:thiol peroxidase